MNITRRSDYACRILRAAYKNQGQCISVMEVAENEQIPYKFARSIQHDLVKAGLIETTRGAKGGISLSCDPEKTTLFDILQIAQGPVSVAPCVIEVESCTKRENCDYNKAWCGADKILRDYLSSITLHDLFELGGDHPSIKPLL